MADLPLIPGTLATDCYPASPQALYDEMFNRGHAVGDDVTGLLIQDAVPDPEYQGVVGWIPTSGNVPRFPGYVFVWHASLGHWVSRHSIGASDTSRRIYVGDSADVPTYDGGEAGVAAVASGPFWEIDTLFDGRVPVGAGNIPGTSPAISIAVRATQDSATKSGEYKHTLTDAEGGTGDHVHPMGRYDSGAADVPYVTPDVAVPSYTGVVLQGIGAAAGPDTAANIFTLPSNNGAGVTMDAHNNMQPYYGVFFLKRTIRQFYRAD